MNANADGDAPFSRYQIFLIAILSFLQFTVTLDFMILYPLGIEVMPQLKISPAQFGFVVSAYAFSAGISGLLAAGFLDRFDRKKILLFFYVGFIVGTALCAMANSYYLLLFARIMTGLFGGVIASVVFAIITDLFPFQMRGRVVGYVQTAFSATQIFGYPIGLFFVNLHEWRAAFIAIVAVSIPAGILILWKLKPVNEHLKLITDKNSFKQIYVNLTIPKYLLAFAGTALLSIGGYMLTPLGGVFTVNNLEISVKKLHIIYLVGGLFSFIIGPMVGQICDLFGKIQTIIFGTVVLIISVIYFTNLEKPSLFIVIVGHSMIFMGIIYRLIPAQVLISAVPEQNHRGSFMAVNSSIQQIAGGIAAATSGMIITQNAQGVLKNYDTVGYVVAVMSVVSLISLIFVNKIITRAKPATVAT